MLPNKLPFTGMQACRTYASASVKSCSRRRRHWRLLLVRNLSESHARHARIPSQTKERPYSARGSVQLHPRNSRRTEHAVSLDSARWNARWAFQSHTSAPERACCRSAKPRRQLRARTQSKLKHSASGPGGRAVPIDSARAGSHLMWLPCEPGLDRSGTACPPGPLRQFLTYPIPREERE